MIKTIATVGNSDGLIFDAALLQLAQLQPGDLVNVEVHPSGTITITPLNRPLIDEAAAVATAKRIIGKNDDLFQRLS